MSISAASGTGIKEMLFEAKSMAHTEAIDNPVVDMPIIRMDESSERWEVIEDDHGFMVTGRKIERFAERTDFSSQPGVQRLHDIMKKMGIIRELERRGAEAGQKIRIGKRGSVEL